MYPRLLHLFPFVISHLIVGKHYYAKFDRAWNITSAWHKDIIYERKVKVLFVLKQYSVTGFCCFIVIKSGTTTTKNTAYLGESSHVVIRDFYWCVRV